MNAKLSELKSLSWEQLVDRYSAAEVAQGIADKVSLKYQEVTPRRRTRAEKRRLAQLGRLAIAMRFN